MFKKHTKNAHNRFYILFAILTVLLIARYALQIEIPRIVLTSIIVVIAFGGDKNEILAIAMCCMPLHESVDFYSSIIVCAGAYILKYPKRIKVGYNVILFFVMIIWEILHCFTSDFSFKLFFVSITPLIFLMVVLCIDLSEIDYAFIVRATAFASVSVCIMCLANCIVQADYDLLAAAANLRRLGVIADDETLIGGVVNPNTIGVLNILSTTTLFQLRITNKGNKIDILFIIMLLGFGILTSSRTFLVCLILMVLLLVLGYPGSMRKKLKFFIFMAMAGVVAVSLIAWLFPDLLEYYIGRFMDDDITTGRDVIFITLHNQIWGNQRIALFGLGLNNFSDKVVNIYRLSTHTPHNSIQEIIIAWGIPGLIMISLLFVIMITQSNRYSGRKTIMNYIPLLIILAKSMVGQLLTSGYTMLALAFAYLSLCQDFSHTKPQ